MEGFPFSSCIHFSCQLMAAEAAFLLFFPRRSRFWLRLLGSLALFAVLLRAVFLLVTQVPGDVLAVRILYYSAVFAMSVGVMWFCFDLSQTELLFAAVGGYALQHLAFGITRVLSYFIPLGRSTLPERFFYHWALYLLLPALFYWFVIRRRCDREELKRRNPRMLWLAAMILVSAIVVSLMARTSPTGTADPFFQELVGGLYI